MKLHLLFAPDTPWKRKSPAYHQLHEQLRSEVDRPAPPRQSAKQNIKYAKSELFRLYAEEV